MATSKRKKRKLSRRQEKQLVFLSFLILIAAVLSLLLITPGFNIKKIEISGNSVVQDDQIRRALGTLEGENIFSVNLKNAKKNILSIGYVESAKIKRKLPSTIQVSVVEEVGVAYIKAEKGYVIITADGKCIDITDGTTKNEENDKVTANLPDMPVITGVESVGYKIGKTITSENQAKLDALFSCLHEFSRQEYVFDMIEINMSDLNNIRFYFLTRDLCVSVGDGSNLSYKMECFGPILNAIGTNPKGYIDLERLTYRPPETKKSE